MISILYFLVACSLVGQIAQAREQDLTLEQKQTFVLSRLPELLQKSNLRLNPESIKIHRSNTIYDSLWAFGQRNSSGKMFLEVVDFEASEQNENKIKGYVYLLVRMEPKGDHVLGLTGGPLNDWHSEMLTNPQTGDKGMLLFANGISVGNVMAPELDLHLPSGFKVDQSPKSTTSNSQTTISPVEVCKALATWTSDYNPSDCLAVIKDGSFDPYATAVCYNLTNSFKSDYSPIACMKVVKNGTFEPNAVAVCRALTNAWTSDYSPIECLKIIQGHSIDPNALPVCAANTNGWTAEVSPVECLKSAILP